MEAASIRNCPSCGMPVEAGAAFCDSCGAVLPPEDKPAPAANPPAEAAPGTLAAKAFRLDEPAASPRTAAAPNGGSPGAAFCDGCGAVLPPEDKPAPAANPLAEATPGAMAAKAFRLDEPAVSPRAAAAPNGGSPDAPFSFEWDDARQFIAGSGGAFAYRMTFRCCLDSVVISVSVNGEALAPAEFPFVRAGETREGSFQFTPKMAGVVKADVGVEVVMADRVRESFTPMRQLTGMALSGNRVDVVGGAGSFTINAGENTGINRFDGMNLGALGGVKVDRWSDERSVFDRPAEWRDVPFASCRVGFESVRLCCGGRTLTVASGAAPVAFGRSARRADVQLCAMAPDGCVDESRTRYLSGVHFTLSESNGAIVLRDGGCEQHQGSRVWRKSSNGIAINGRMSVSDERIQAGRPVKVVLAPYAIPGGALSLSMEAQDRSRCIAGCDAKCDVASLSILPEDSPDKALLVVWGSAGIDGLLGAVSGFQVGLVRGRLRVIAPDGSSERLMHLVGGAIPGTGIFVQ